MSNRITANAAIDVFNRLVTMEERAGKIRRVDVPFTSNQALKEQAQRCGEATRKKMSKLTLELQSEIQARHLTGETAKSLAGDFEVSEKTTIFKAIHGGYKKLGIESKNNHERLAFSRGPTFETLNHDPLQEYSTRDGDRGDRGDRAELLSSTRNSPVRCQLLGGKERKIVTGFPRRYRGKN
jgi:hypothetical protein